MKAHELAVGQHFRVVGLYDWWECVTKSPSAIKVRSIKEESRSFVTLSGDEVTISFHPRAFYISRETSVEVDA